MANHAGDVTKEKRLLDALLNPFVFVVSFVFRLFPAKYGRAKRFQSADSTSCLKNRTPQVPGGHAERWIAFDGVAKG